MNLWDDRDFTPMLLGETDKPFDSGEYIFELKFDGMRSLVFASPKEVRVYNRRKVDITSMYPELEGIRKIVKRNTIFDGEIVAMEDGLPSFSKLQNRVHLKDEKKIKKESISNPVVFVCFDILYDDKSLIDEPIENRKKKLEHYEENEVFIKSRVFENEGVKLFKKVQKLTLEGIVAKKKGSSYEINKRSDSWLKIKNFKCEEFYIGGFIEKEENYVISLLIGEYKDKKLYFLGKVSLGKRTSLYKGLKSMAVITQSPFFNYDEKGISYVEPKLKCKVNYMERTKNGSLRQPFIR